MAYLSTVAYAFIAALVEGGISMGLWALDERRDRLERAKAEGREEGREEGRKEGRTTAVNEYEDKLAAARERARAEGIDLDKYLNL